MTITLPKKAKLAAVALLMAAASPSLQAQEAQSLNKTAGIELGYVSRNTSCYAGVYARFRLGRIFAIKPRLDYVLRHKNADAFMANIDCHFIIPLRSQQWELYAIAGAGLESWNIRAEDPDGVAGQEAGQRHSGLGADLGAGVAVNVTPTLRLALEAKANLVTKYSTALVGVSIGYNF